MAKVDPKAFVTNETLNKTLDEAVDTILKGMDSMISDFKVEVKTGFQEVGERFNKVDGRLEKIETDLSFMKDDIKGLTADLSDTVTKKEFNKLKSKVDKYATT